MEAICCIWKNGSQIIQNAHDVVIFASTNKHIWITRCFVLKSCLQTHKKYTPVTNFY